MNEKYSLESFTADIDKIVSGETFIPPAREDCSQEDMELLLLAQLLTKADYSMKTRERLENIILKIKHYSEMEDDELDMVAGGINLNDLLDEKGKKNGI